MREFVVNKPGRLDKFLAENLSNLSRGEIQKAIKDGNVEVNGKIFHKVSLEVGAGDRVKFKITNSKFKITNPEVLYSALNILYEGRGIIIIDKPAGLTVHGGPAVKGVTLVDILLQRYPEIKSVGEPDRPGIVHRLDKDTSGCMVVALTQEMYEYLTEAFFSRKVKKEYLALVWGKLSEKHGFINKPIGKSKLDFRKMTVQDPLQSKESVTEYWVEREFDETSLIKLLLHTGRTHQIRVHLASIGHPLCGDGLYGPKKKLQGLDRQFLHASSLEIQLPDESWIEVQSDLPEDLKKVLIILTNIN